jgi:GntR family carbon starvation induced transcriptional regulator
LKVAGKRTPRGAVSWKLVDANSVASASRPSAGTTRATKVYRRIRDDILNGRLPPAAKLRFDSMRTNYNSGLAPLREALTRLAFEDLVVLQDQKGFYVSPVSIEDLKDLTQARLLIEIQALRLSLERGDDEWEARLLASYHRLKKSTDKQGPGRISDFPEWEERHREFHHQISSACGSRHLVMARDRLFDLSDRYRRLIPLELDPSLSGPEHAEMVKLALARDMRILPLMQKHIQQTCDHVLSQLESLASPDTTREQAKRSRKRQRR